MALIFILEVNNFGSALVNKLNANMLILTLVTC